MFTRENKKRITMKNRFLSSGMENYDKQNHSGLTEIRKKQAGVSLLKTRALTDKEINTLVKNRNTSDNWTQIHVKEPFNPELVRECDFRGFVRIGRLEEAVLKDSERNYYCGLRNSLIISSDIGDYCSIENNRYISHIITGNYVILSCNNEIYTTESARFGNCIRKDGDSGNDNNSVDVINENGGRGVKAFSGILASDFYLAARYRDRLVLQDKLNRFTDSKFDSESGYYSFIDDYSVIKNCSTVYDIMTGRSAFIKGAARAGNITVNSRSDNPSMILDNCIAVNGITGEGCRIESSAILENFVLGDFCTVKLGARLIHSYLGDFSTVACGEVLNSLIYPCHEQHHNSSFLIAASVQGQSNIASGATIGSNHNSRMNDCELWAERGFWPGLCASFKHNSRFASFCLLSKSAFPYELDIKFPFSLVNNNEESNTLEIIPAYWWLYNMYALIRNFFKYRERTLKGNKKPLPEFDFLAPDTVEEIIAALYLIEKKRSEAKDIETESKSINFEVSSENIENSSRDVRLLKINKSIKGYREMLLFYCGSVIFSWIKSETGSKEALFSGSFTKERIQDWINFGGHIVPEQSVYELVGKIEKGELISWDEVHLFTEKQIFLYPGRKLSHAVSVLLYLYDEEKISEWLFKKLENEYRTLLNDVVYQIRKSRKKDYDDDFRIAVYRNSEELESVIGKFEDDKVADKFREYFIDILNI